MTEPEQLRNVLIIESGEGVGGSAFSMFRIVKYLDKSKYRPHVVVYYRTEVFEEIKKLGIPVTVLPLYSPFSRNIKSDDTVIRRCINYLSVYGGLLIDTAFNGLRLARFIRKNSIEIVHCNNGFFENFAAAFAARVTATPCICHVRGTEPLMKIERILQNWVTKVIVLNHDMFDVYVDTFGADKVHLVENGVDLDLFQNNDPRKIRKEFSIDTDSFCVGTFARLVNGKGIPEFLSAAAKSSATVKNLTFFVAGGGAIPDSEFESQLREQCTELGLDNRVIFAGWRDDIPDCMAAMDLILQISTTYPEGMSLAPIEAMAVSKPVIVSDNPGYVGVVEHGETGYIVPASNVDRLAELICRLASNAALTDKLGKNGYARLLKKFEYRIVVKNVQDVYVQALAD